MYQSYAVGWFALVLINANIAQLKGHSGSNSFLGSLFTGPVATFFLALTKPRAKPVTAN